MRTRSGTVSQSGLRYDEGDYEHERINSPVLGIVLNVYASDDGLNRSGNFAHDGRGSTIEARVLVINDGSDSPWILPNVVVLPRGSSGFDNYQEEIPRGVTGAIDDAQLPANFTQVSPTKLDGDWCVVDFIGGSYSQPFIAAWWPHPANRRDPATAGVGDALSQNRRMVRRFQGTRFAVTSKGTVLVDTSEANHLIKKGKRAVVDEGGDIRVTVKESRQLELNWNASVFGDPDEVDFLWEQDTQAHAARATTSTKVTFGKDVIQAIAGEVVKLIAQRGDIIMSTPQGKIQVGLDADEPIPLGNKLIQTIQDMINNAIMNTAVPTLFGPSGTVVQLPANVPLYAPTLAELPLDLSTFAFTRRDPK